jgi:hypothetical protein
MSGGITQLVAVGVQDAYLSGNPEVSFFRSSYKRYTHHAKVVERQLIQGTPTSNGVSLIRFEKKGDLLSDVYLSANDPNNTANTNVNWSQIISKMELMIGGQIIDTQDVTYCSNIDSVVNAKSYSQRYVAANVNSCVFFPLKFFFCRDWQSVLPLVALQYHDVEIRITWAQPNVWDQYIAWARFIYLDSAEREWFAKNKHDMLITQVTRVPIAPVNNFEFALAQPIKYIAFESNNYNTVYNTGGSSMNIPVISTNSLSVGMPVSIPNYLSSNTYISAVSDSTITIPVPITQSMPAGTAVNFNTITGNFTLTGNSTSKIVTVTSGTTSLASLPTQIATGWEVLVAGPSVTAALAVIVYNVLTVTITNGVISALTLNASADASAFSGTSANLLFMPTNSVNTSINSLGSFATTFAVTASGTTNTVTLTTSSPHNIPTTGTFTAQISGLVTTGSTANGQFTITPVNASTFTYTAGGSVTAFTTSTGTMTITAYTLTAGNSTPIQSSTPTYISVNVPGNFQTNMVGYTVVVPQVGTGASSFAVGTITSVDNSITGSTVNPPAGASLVTVQFPSTGTYPTTTQITTSATAASATLFYTYPPFVYTETVVGGSLNQGSLAASNMQFKMQINGNDVGESISLPHWVDVNQYYLTPYGYYSLTAGNGLNGVIPVAIIPFCLDTAKLQPTGSLNFSRIDTFRLICPSQTNFQQLSKLGNGSYFYAVNYNVLRIQNGMGAVMYSS